MKLPKIRFPPRAALGRTLGHWVLSGGRDAAHWIERETVLSPEARAGAGVFAALFLLSFLQGAAGGPAGEGVGAAERALYRAGALIFSLGLGFLGGFLCRHAWDFAGDLSPRLRRAGVTWPWRAAVVAFLCLWIHGGFLAGDMVRRPALYQSAFYDQGGLWRWVQVFVTDLCPHWLLGFYRLTGGLVLAAAFVQLLRRGIQWAARLPRPTLVASVVLGGGVAAFLLGLSAVLRAQSPRNQGPNVLFLAVGSLRADVLRPDDAGPLSAPRLNALARQGRTYPFCAPPLPETGPALMTLLTGRTPLSHGVRHSFPAAPDLRLGEEDLPAILRRGGYATAVLADAGGGLFSRLGDAFDETRAPSDGLRAAAQRRVLKGHPHLLPYLRGPWARRALPALRGMPELSAPGLLAAEAEDLLEKMRRRKKFFLLVYFSALQEPYALQESPSRAALDPSYRGACKYALAAGPAQPRHLPPEDRARVRTLYDANVRAVDRAAGRLLDALKKSGLDENTLVALWSPHGEELFDRNGSWGHGDHLRGPEVLSAPLVLREPRQRTAPRWIPEPVRAQDVAPTLLSLLGFSVPPEMEGFPLDKREFGLPPEEAFLAYAETGLWRFPRNGGSYQADRIMYPPVPDALERDPEAPDHWRLRPAWEDHVLVAKHRMIQLGWERLIYVPTRRHGVRYELYDFSQDPQGLKDLSRTPEGAERIKELKEVLFRYLAGERGWRPQNGYWIPEAFLDAS